MKKVDEYLTRDTWGLQHNAPKKSTVQDNWWKYPTTLEGVKEMEEKSRAVANALGMTLE